MSHLADLRKDYDLAGLSEKDVARDPFRQFERWFQEAEAARLVEPNAMVLATVADGRPVNRAERLDLDIILDHTPYLDASVAVSAANGGCPTCSHRLRSLMASRRATATMARLRPTRGAKRSKLASPWS